MSPNYFDKVREYLTTLDLDVIHEDADEQLVVVCDENRGISSLIIDCEEELLVVEHVIFPVPSDRTATYKRLLQINRELVHGAFALDAEGRHVLFRDTLQLANLDLNELDATINALALALASYAGELIEFAHAD